MLESADGFFKLSTNSSHRIFSRNSRRGALPWDVRWRGRHPDFQSVTKTSAQSMANVALSACLQFWTNF